MGTRFLAKNRLPVGYRTCEFTLSQPTLGPAPGLDEHGQARYGRRTLNTQAPNRTASTAFPLKRIALMPDSLFFAVLLGWILTVCVHEYAHALTAYLCGDKSVADRGYLTMNPLSYIDPMTSLLLPVFALWMGGIALPGGAVQINLSALRKR